MKDGCTLDELKYINNADDAASEVTQIPFHDPERLKDVVGRSADLQRRLCALYYHDFVCLGYELLDACKGPADDWLEGAIEDLMNDAPLEKLSHPDHAKPQELGHLSFL